MESGMKKAGMKSFALALALLLVLFSFASCGKDGGKSGKEIYDQLAAGQAEKMKFAEELSLLDKETACRTYGIDEEKAAEISVFISSGAYVDEFAVFLAADGVKADELKTAAQARIDAQKKLYSSYKTEEIPKLDNALILSKGNLVVVLIGGDEATVSYVKEALQ